MFYNFDFYRFIDKKVIYIGAVSTLLIRNIITFFPFADKGVNFGGPYV